MNTRQYIFLMVIMVSGLAACGQFPSRHDSAPRFTPADLHRIPNAIPKSEPLSKWGNPAQYTVLGKTYKTLSKASGYKAKGIASWYGTKFHGRTTSNGEIYDMFAMTAAHKSLPLPTYVQVTNLDNGKKVIVRVNDRGPFHENRVIDLSYTAAYKLDMLGKGTARVEVEAIGNALLASNPPVKPMSKTGVSAETPEINAGKSASPMPQPIAGTVLAERKKSIQENRYFIRVGKFKDKQEAEATRARIALGLARTSGIKPARNSTHGMIYLVQLGPFGSVDDARQIVGELNELGLNDVRIHRRGESVQGS